jgi:hypothetical protein
MKSKTTHAHQCCKEMTCLHILKLRVTHIDAFSELLTRRIEDLVRTTYERRCSYSCLEICCIIYLCALNMHMRGVPDDYGDGVWGGWATTSTRASGPGASAKQLTSHWHNVLLRQPRSI